MLGRGFCKTACVHTEPRLSLRGEGDFCYLFVKKKESWQTPALGKCWVSGGACRGRVGVVSGSCRGRVGGVSGACRVEFRIYPDTPPTRPRHAPDTPPPDTPPTGPRQAPDRPPTGPRQAPPPGHNFRSTHVFWFFSLPKWRTFLKKKKTRFSQPTKFGICKRFHGPEMLQENLRIYTKFMIGFGL